MTELETKLLNIISDIRGLREEEENATIAVQKLQEALADEEDEVRECKFKIRVLEDEMEDIIAQLTGEDNAGNCS